MKLKRKRKSSRQRGSQTHGRGAKERTRGSGNRGGVGMAGSGKRADQKKTLVIKLTGGNNYFGKSKTLRRGNVAKKLEPINLKTIEKNIESMIKLGRAKENKEFYEINLEKNKILGDGEIKIKVKIFAGAASASAIEKIKNAGGEIIIKEAKKTERQIKTESNPKL